MFAITVELLTGRFVATSPVDRDRHEWPPHPARLFSALVATWAEIAEDDPAAREALEWLERQPAPVVLASATSVRTPCTHYVPVNGVAVVSPKGAARLAGAQAAVAAADTPVRRDKADAALAAAVACLDPDPRGPSTSALREARELMPEGRPRRERRWPSSTPAVPRVHFVWPDSDAPTEVVDAIDLLLDGVTGLGHSSSLVACRVNPAVDPDAAAGEGMRCWTPDPGGRTRMRVPVAGLLTELERSFAEHQGCRPRNLPQHIACYTADPGANTAARPLPDTAGQWLVFAHTGGPRLPITAAAELASAVRAALMSHCTDPVPELISGHRPVPLPGRDGHRRAPTGVADGGAASVHPHVAVVALPFVGHEHADGHLMGFAVQLPADPALLGERDALIAAIGRWEGAARGRDHRVAVQLAGGRQLWFSHTPDPQARTLQRHSWAGPARTWVSVTPIALDRHPGDLGSRDPAAAGRAAEHAEATIARACRHLGLPAPVAVAVTGAVLVTGSRPARAFPAFRPGRAGSPQRMLVHARVSFAQEIDGPLLLGAGRFLGLGLMVAQR